MVNEKRLIDANALRAVLKNEERDCEVFPWAVDNAPTVDAVEVVRCRDCKHCTEAFDGNPCCGRFRTSFPYVREGDFCSYGQRRTEQ